MKGALRFRFGLLTCLLGVGPPLDKPLVWKAQDPCLQTWPSCWLRSFISTGLMGKYWSALTKSQFGQTWQEMSDAMGHLAMTRELQMSLLPLSEVLLACSTLNMDYHFKFAACLDLPVHHLDFPPVHVTRHTVYTTTGICYDIKRLKMLPATQGLPGLAALPGLPQAMNPVETMTTCPPGWR